MDESSLEGTLDTVEFTLINLVKEYPELYNAHDPAYRDKQRKDLAWAEIARHMNKDEGWCYAKWKNLSDYYKKRKKIYGNGASMTMRRWVYYDALSFLDSYENNIREDASSRSSTEYHQGYFDETQYHSLDGITNRSEVKMQHFLEPLVETESSCPPSKKQRVATTNSTYNQTESTLTKSNRQGQHTLRSDAVVNFECDDDDDDEDPISVEAVLNKQSSQAPISKSIISTKNVQKNGNSYNNSTTMTNSLNSCPHYHFSMSLAARFRKMDPAKATFMQMKIMELFLKTEFPDEYKQRVVDN